MHADRSWKRARDDAGTAVEEFGEAASILASNVVSSVASHAASGLDDARTSLARAIDPAPVTPAPTTAPTEDALFGKPVGQSPTRSAQ